MLIVEIDDVDVEPLEGCFGDALHVGGRAVDRARRPVEFEAEFRGDDEAFTLAGDRAAQEFFVGEGSVDLSRVEKRHAEFDRAVDGANRFAFICGAVRIRHPHAAEPERRYRQALGSEFALFHTYGFAAAELMISVAGKAFGMRPYFAEISISGCRLRGSR